MRKTESRNLYLGGFAFWKERTFWRNEFHTPKAKAYMDKWLAGLQSEERSLTKLG